MSVNLGSVVAHLELDTSKYMSSLKAAQTQMAQFSSSSLTGMEKLSAVGQGMTSVGATMTKAFTLPLAGIAAGATKVGSDFQAAMSSVQALSGATGEDLEMLEEKARNMAKNTVFSATEAAEALGYMSLAGWDATESAEGLEPVLKLAGAANMDLANASNIVTDVLSAFSMEAEEATRLTDALAFAQANSNTSVEELSEGFKYAAASANAMGYDVEDTTAILGLLADNMLKGSIGGTTLNSMFRDMKKNSEDGAIAIGNSNVAIVDANGNYRDFAEILADVEKATEGMTQADKDATLTKIWGTEAMKGVNILLSEGSDTLQDFERNMRNADGTANDMYDTMNDNLKGSIEGFKSSLEEAGLSIYQTLEPALKLLVDGLTRLVDGFTSLPGPVQGAIVVFGGLLAIIGPLLIIGGQFAIAIVNINSALALTGGLSGLVSSGLGILAGAKTAAAGAGGLLTGALTGIMASASAAATAVWALIAPLLPIVAAIAAVIAIGVLLYKNWDTVGEKAGQLAGWLGDSFSAIGDSIGNGWNKAREWTSSAWDSITQTVEENGGGLSGILKTAMDNMHWVWFPGLSLLDKLTGGHIKEMAGNMVDGLRELPSRFAQMGRDAIDGLVEGLENLASAPVDFIRGLGGDIIDGFKDVMNINSPSIEMKELGQGTAEGLEYGLRDGEDLVVTASRDIGTSSLMAFREALDEGEFVLQGTTSMEAFAKGIEDSGESIRNTTEETIKSSMLEAFDNIDATMMGMHGISMGDIYRDMHDMDDIEDVGEEVVDRYADGILEGKEGAEDAAEEVADSVADKLEEAKRRVNQLGGAIENALKNKYKEAERVEIEHIEKTIKAREQASKNTIDSIKKEASAVEEVIRGRIKAVEDTAKQEIEAIQKRAQEVDRISKREIESIERTRDAKIKALEAQRRAERRASDERLKELQKLERAEQRAVDAKIESINRNSKARIDAIERTARREQDALQARIRDVKRVSDAQIEQIRRAEQEETASLNRRVDAVRKATDEKIKQYDREYNEQLKVIDREMYDQINAVQKQIDAIDEATRREDRAREAQAHNTRVSELQKQIAMAKTSEERMRLTRQLNETIADWERKLLLEQRENQKDALRDQIDAIRSNHEARKEILRQEIEEKKAAEQEKLDATIQALEEEMRKVEEAANARIAEEERKREALEESLQAQLEQNKQALEDKKKAEEEKAQAAIDALKKELQEFKDSIEEKQEAEKNRMDALEENWDKEKESIGELADMQKKAEEERAQAHKDALEAERTAVEKRLEDQKAVLDAELKTINESRDARIQAEQDKLNASKETLSQEKDAVKAHYAEITDADKLRHETAKMLQKGSSDEIMALLKEYNPKWQSQGQDYASMMTEGIRSELIPMVEEINEILGFDPTVNDNGELEKLHGDLDHVSGSAHDATGEIDAVTGAAPMMSEEMDDAARAAEGLGGATSLAGGEIREIKGDLDETTKSVEGLGDTTTEHVGIMEVLGNALKKVFSGLDQSANDNFSSMSMSVDKAMSASGSSFDDFEDTAIDSMTGVVDEADKLPPEMEKSGTNMGKSLGSGLKGQQSSLSSITQGMGTRITSGLRSLPSQMLNAGRNAGRSLAQGIRSAMGQVVAAARSLANSASGAMRGALRINSPSKEGEEIGAFTGEGFGLGIMNSIRMVQRSAGRLADGTMDTLQNAVKGSKVDMSANSNVNRGVNAMDSSGDRGSSKTEVNLHIGTLVADDMGLKQLERKLRDIRLVENSRLGGAY